MKTQTRSMNEKDILALRILMPPQSKEKWCNYLLRALKKQIISDSEWNFMCQKYSSDILNLEVVPAPEYEY